ncbi:MAG: hypothetical protein [Caudoviricetes sp.]|nr:MAG: hypothetical protein [Caudoviricetes sp.]
MLTITLNQTEFAHKDQIVAFLEDEIFASKVHSVLVRAIDETIGYQQ